MKRENAEIDIKGCFEVLCLFFVLGVISVIMIYSRFEKEMAQATTRLNDDSVSGITNLDSMETGWGVSDFYKQQLFFEYVNTGGEVDVFSSILDVYMEE